MIWRITRRNEYGIYNKDMSKHSKHYYEQGRNGSTTSSTGSSFNPKMLLSKESLELTKDTFKNFSDFAKQELDYSKDKIPNYYIGKVYGYEARKVIEDFDLSYNIGTATTYLLRAKRKHTTSVECIQKAINHLEFELDKIKNEETDI